MVGTAAWIKTALDLEQVLDPEERKMAWQKVQSCAQIALIALYELLPPSVQEPIRCSNGPTG